MAPDIKKLRFENRYDFDLKSACRFYGFLVLHDSFWDASNEELCICWNGIGADGDWFNSFIPRTAWGLRIELASLQHDYDWLHSCGDEHDFHVSNLFFLHNMNQIVREYSSSIMRPLRFMRTNKYYIVVETDRAWNYYMQVNMGRRPA